MNFQPPVLSTGNGVGKGGCMADAAEGRHKHRYRHARLTHSGTKNNLYRRLYLPERQPAAFEEESVEDTPTTVHERYHHANNHVIHTDSINHCASPLEIGTVNSSRSSDEDSSYIGCVSFHSSPLLHHHQNDTEEENINYPQQVSMPTNKLSDKKRNNRFKRFVAHKQIHRARALKNQPELTTTVGVEHQLYSRVSEVVTEQVCGGTSNVEREKVHTELEGSRSPTRLNIAKPNLDESPTSVTQSLEQDYACDASVLDIKHQRTECVSTSEESPKSVSQFLSVAMPPHGSKDIEPPEMSRGAVKKQIFKSNSTQKCIIQQNGEKKAKNLSWWDDDENKQKPFTLKTDEFDCDDDSTWFYVERNCGSKCNERIQEFIRQKRSSWIEEEENSPYEAPELDLFSSDDAIDSDDDDPSRDHNPLDKRRQKILGDLLGFYRNKLEASISQAVEASKSWDLEGSFSMNSIDGAISSMTEDEKMSSLFQVDLFDVSGSFLHEEENSIGECSDTTPQACNTSCFA